MNINTTLKYRCVITGNDISLRPGSLTETYLMSLSGVSFSDIK